MLLTKKDGIMFRVLVGRNGVDADDIAGIIAVRDPERGGLSF